VPAGSRPWLPCRADRQLADICVHAEDPPDTETTRSP